MRKFSYVTPIAWFTLVMLAVILPPVFSPLQPIPAKDADLDRILEKIKPYEDLANHCAAADCPELDCATAQQMQIKLRDARIIMRYTSYWLTRAADDQLRHLTNISNESIATNARAIKVQKIMAYQQWIVGISSGMLEIASLSTNINDILNDPKLLQSKSYGEMANLLDTFYESMKDGESLIGRLREGRNDQDFPKPVADMMPALEGLSSSEMNDLKSTFSDVKTLMEAAQKHGKDWRAILKEGKGTTAIGQIAGRYLKAYAESQIAERKRLVDSLLNDVLAQDAAQSQAFKDLGRMQARRNKAEDAYLALDRLLVATSGQGQMTHCLLKMQKSCTGLDLNYASAYPLPADVEVVDFRVISEEDRRKSWGNALLKINKLLPTVESWLQDVPHIQVETLPSLQLNKFAFRSGEEIAVRAKVSHCQKPSIWVGIVPAETMHGNEAQNAQQVLSGKQELSATATGALRFNAPQQSGQYDVRMSDSVSGKELVSLSFQVGCNTPEETKMIPVADALRRIERLEKTIQDRRQQMNYRYNEHAKDTLLAEFQHSKVYSRARSYANSWSGNGIYLTWINRVARYYNVHAEALKDSAHLIKSSNPPSVRQSDIVYLENGVTTWQHKEKQLSDEMFMYVYHMAKYAYFIGESMRIKDDPCFWSSDCPGHQALWAPRAAAFDEQAKIPAEMEKQAQQRATDLAAQKIFSSLKESNRIASENDGACP